MPFIQLQFRRGTASQWTSANPILADGELAIESDTSKFKIGNGNASWNFLPYGGLVGPTGSISSIVSQDISFNGNIFVGKDISLSGKLTARNDVSFNTELRVGGNTNIRSSAQATSSGSGALIVAGGAGVGGNVWTGGNLVVGADASLNNSLAVGSNVVTGGNLNISKTTVSTSSGSGALIVAGGAGVGGNIWTAGNLNVALDTSLNSRLLVGGNVIIGANLFVGLDTSFNGNATFANLPYYNGSATPASNQLVTKSYVDSNGGTILLGSNNTWTANNTFNGSRFFVNADASFQNKLTVGDDVSLNARLFVGRDSSLNGNLHVGRNLVVGGDVSLNDNLSVQSDSSFNNGLYVGRRIGVGVTANSFYSLDVLGNINLSGNLYLNNQLFSITSADISLNANLSVGADASFNGNVFVSRSLNFRKTVVTGAATGSPTTISVTTPIIELTGSGASTAYFTLANGSFSGQTLIINSATNGGGGGLFVNPTGTNIVFNGSNCTQMRFSSAFQTVYLVWSSAVSQWIVASWQGVNFASVSMNFSTYTTGDITFGSAGRVNINPSVGGMVVGSDSSFNGNLSVGGTDLSFNANLYIGLGKRVGIGKTAGANFILDVSGNINLTGNLHTNGVLFTAFDNSKDISLNANITVAFDSSFNSNLFIGRRLTVGAGDVSFNQRLTVGGADSSFNGNLYVGRRLVVDSADVSFNQRLTVGGADSSFNGNLFIGRRLTVSAGDVSLNQRLTVGGADSSFNGNLYVGGYVNSDAFVERFVNVSSSSGTYTADFNSGLVIYVNSFSGSSSPTLSITNLPTVLNQSYVFTVVYSGAATSTYFSALNINGVSVPLNGSVALTAATSYYVHQFCIFFTDATTLSNNLVVQNFNSSAPVSLVSPLISGNLAVNGNINLTGGNIFQNGALFTGGGGGSVGPSLSLEGNLYVGGDISFGGKLYGNGDVSFSQRLFVGSDVSMGGNLVVRKTTASTSSSTGALIVSGGVGIDGALYTNNNVNTTGVINTTNSTATTSGSTGALVVNGGAGIGGNVWTNSRLIVGLDASFNGNVNIGGNINLVMTSQSTSSTTGALIVRGGVGVGGNVQVGGNIRTAITTASTSSTTGALIVGGGAGIAGNIYAGGNLYVTGSIVSPTLAGTPIAPTASVGTNTTQIATTAYVRSEISALVASAPSTLDTLNELATALGNDAAFSTTITNSIGLKANIASPIFTGTISTPAASVTNSTASSSTSTGALIVSGGAGVAGALYTGGIVNVGSTTASTSTSSGALIVGGGAGLGGNLQVGGNIQLTGILKSNNNLDNKKIALYEDNNIGVASATDFYGFGVNAAVLRYQTVGGGSNRHHFYSGTSDGIIAGGKLVLNGTSALNMISTPPDPQPGSQYGTDFPLLITSPKAPVAPGTSIYGIGLGVDYTTGYGFISCAGNSLVQPLIIQPRATSTTGNVGIGITTNPTTMLQVGGAVTAVSFNATSDYRIKQNVHLIIEDASFNVDVLKPVSYLNTQLGKSDIGFIAHEVQEHYPYLVNGEKDGDAMQTLNYTGIIGILTKEIQELKKRVRDLELRG